MRKRIEPLYGRQAQEYRQTAPAFQQVWDMDEKRARAAQFALTGQYQDERWWEECARLGHSPRCANLQWHQVICSRERRS